ncbi:transposase [Exiguobacterium mexicanum]|uniref:transposase n=1 Tax=Exiguobacterium mexicanum TaxID=340146 RepID=UPI00110F43E7
MNQCPLREGCYKDGAKSKSYSVSLNSRNHSDQLLDYEQIDEFREYRRKRFEIEPKNSQLKNPQGLASNKTSNLKGMTLQSVMAIVVVGSIPLFFFSRSDRAEVFQFPRHGVHTCFAIKTTSKKD